MDRESQSVCELLRDSEKYREEDLCFAQVHSKCPGIKVRFTLNWYIFHVTRAIGTLFALHSYFNLLIS